MSRAAGEGRVRLLHDDGATLGTSAPVSAADISVARMDPAAVARATQRGLRAVGPQDGLNAMSAAHGVPEGAQVRGTGESSSTHHARIRGQRTVHGCTVDTSAKGPVNVDATTAQIHPVDRVVLAALGGRDRQPVQNARTSRTCQTPSPGKNSIATPQTSCVRCRAKRVPALHVTSWPRCC